MNKKSFVALLLIVIALSFSQISAHASTLTEVEKTKSEVKKIDPEVKKALMKKFQNILKKQSSKSSIWEENKLIAHAMGGIDGITYTNSLEAFLHNYEIGYRIFEVDIVITSDDQLVIRHYWDEEPASALLQTLKEGMQYPLSLSEFEGLKIYEKYTPLSFEDIVDLMVKYPDVYIVTDTKGTEKDQIESTFEKIVKTASAKNESVLDRIVPQLYNESMLTYVNDIYEFDSYIYTLYATHATDEEVVKFAFEKGIKVIVMPWSRVNEKFLKDLSDKGMFTYVHTFNEVDIVNDYLSKGVHGVYSDFLTPNQFN